MGRVALNSYNPYLNIGAIDPWGVGKMLLQPAPDLFTPTLKAADETFKWEDKVDTKRKQDEIEKALKEASDSGSSVEDMLAQAEKLYAGQGNLKGALDVIGAQDKLDKDKQDRLTSKLKTGNDLAQSSLDAADAYIKSSGLDKMGITNPKQLINSHKEYVPGEGTYLVFGNGMRILESQDPESRPKTTILYDENGTPIALDARNADELNSQIQAKGLRKTPPKEDKPKTPTQQAQDLIAQQMIDSMQGGGQQAPANNPNQIVEKRTKDGRIVRVRLRPDGRYEEVK